METAKIVDAREGDLIPSLHRDGNDVSVKGENDEAKLVSQAANDQHSSPISAESQKKVSTLRETRKGLSKILRIPRPRAIVETEKSRRKQPSARRRNKTLRFSAGPKIPEQEKVEREHSSPGRSSADPKLHRFQGGRSPEQKLGQRMQRSASTEEAVVNDTPFGRISLLRSSSEQEYSTQVLATRVAARNSSRRWQGDAFPRTEQGEEGELDSIFRFIEVCTRAVLNVFKDIPKFVSELPKRAKEALDHFLLLVQGPHVPLLEGPRDSSNEQ